MMEDLSETCGIIWLCNICSPWVKMKVFMGVDHHWSSQDIRRPQAIHFASNYTKNKIIILVINLIGVRIKNLRLAFNIPIPIWHLSEGQITYGDTVGKKMIGSDVSSDCLLLCRVKCACATSVSCFICTVVMQLNLDAALLHPFSSRKSYFCSGIQETDIRTY